MKKDKMAKMIWLLPLALLAGCSATGGERKDYQNDAAKVAALAVPPDMVLPRTDDHYTVPEGGATAASYSEYARSNAQNSACVCKENVAPAAVPPSAPAKLQDSPDGGKRLLLSEPFDRCWLRAAQALDAAGIVVEDKDRSKGQFFLKGGKDQVTVKVAEAGCEVATSMHGDEGTRIIEALYKQLGK